MLDPVLEPTKTTSNKILEQMGNEAKEKLPNFIDDNNGALLVELCKKATALCKTWYWLYNGNGDWKAVAQAQYRVMYGKCKKTWQKLMNDTPNYAANGADKHKIMCQKLCQEELGKRVYLDQCAAMRVGLNYEGHDHKNAAKRLYTVNTTL